MEYYRKKKSTGSFYINNIITKENVFFFVHGRETQKVQKERNRKKNIMLLIQIEISNTLGPCKFDLFFYPLSS